MQPNQRIRVLIQNISAIVGKWNVSLLKISRVAPSNVQVIFQNCLGGLHNRGTYRQASSRIYE